MHEYFISASVRVMFGLNNKGFGPLVVIIAVIFVFGGALAVVTFMNNNQAEIEEAVEESQEAYEDQLTPGYPDLYTEAGLPEYPNGTITKKREGRDLEDGVQVTIESSDNILTAKAFDSSKRMKMAMAILSINIRILSLWFSPRLTHDYPIVNPITKELSNEHQWPCVCSSYVTSFGTIGCNSFGNDICYHTWR